ncbi:hypothetical protein RUND412_003899 [Rhizina undulata]
MYSPTLRTRAPWSTVLPALSKHPKLHLKQSPPTRAPESTADVALPLAGTVKATLHVLLLSKSDSKAEALKRLDKLLCGGGEGVVAVVFLSEEDGGDGNDCDIWELQLAIHETFSEAVPMIPLASVEDLPALLLKFVEEYNAAVRESESRPSVSTSARLLSLVTTNPPLSTHATLVLHSIFPSLKALALDADESTLDILEQGEARGILEFLEEEWVLGDGVDQWDRMNPMTLDADNILSGRVELEFKEGVNMKRKNPFHQ